MFDWVLNTSLNIEQTVVKIEAANGGCSVKKVFLEISQNLHENACVRVSFLIKLQTFCNFSRKETVTHLLSCEFCEISTEQLQMTASVNTS